jgi:methylglyoxal synthase
LTVDTIVYIDYNSFFPNDILLLAFNEQKKNRYMEDKSRKQRNKLDFIFSTPHDSLPTITPLNFEPDSNWYVLETNTTTDTLSYWLRDSLIYNIDTLINHRLYATGTTGTLIREVLINFVNEDYKDSNFDEIYGMSVEEFIDTFKLHRLLSGPLGGDQQIGAMIAEGKIDILIFFCDNLITQGHQQDVGALSRLASLYNIGFASNRTTADMIMTSKLIEDEDYKPIIPAAIERYKNRFNND